MKVSVKYIGEVESNYTRYGLTIPKHETEIDLCKALNCSIERAEFIASQLASDKNLKVNIHVSAGEESKKRKDRVENTAKNLFGRPVLEKRV